MRVEKSELIHLLESVCAFQVYEVNAWESYYTIKCSNMKNYKTRTTIFLENL